MQQSERELQRKQQNQSAKFNTLPTVLIEQIFLDIDSRELYGLKYVCSQWNSILYNMLDIKSVPLPKAVVVDSDYIINKCAYKYGTAPFTMKMFQAPYKLKNLINKPVVSTLAKGSIASNVFRLADFQDAYEQIETAVRKYASPPGTIRKEIHQLAWWIVLSITQIPHSIENLRGKQKKDLYLVQLNDKFQWYLCHWVANGTLPKSRIIALHLDGKTIVLFDFPYTRTPYSKTIGDYEVDDHYSDDEQACTCGHEHGPAGPDFSHDLDRRQREARALEQQLFNLSINLHGSIGKTSDRRQRTRFHHDEQLEDDGGIDDGWDTVDEDEVPGPLSAPLRPMDMFDVPLRPIDMINFGYKRGL
jgi:hypothetical protein